MGELNRLGGLCSSSPGSRDIIPRFSFALFRPLSPPDAPFVEKTTSFVYSHTPFGLRAISSPSFWRMVRSFITFPFEFICYISLGTGWRYIDIIGRLAGQVPSLEGS